MIEVVIDFNKMPLKKEDFILELCNIFHIGRVYGWDAFRDNFRIILYKEWDKYNNEDWKSYEEYLQDKKEDAQYGIKNEQGVRDDIKLVLINFRKFYIENSKLGSLFLEIIFEEIEEVNSDEWRIDGMMNNIEISIR